jgi:hypothetical protein
LTLPYTFTSRLFHTSSPTCTFPLYPAFCMADRTVSSLDHPCSGQISGRYVAESVREGAVGCGNVRWIPCSPGVHASGSGMGVKGVRRETLSSDPWVLEPYQHCRLGNSDSLMGENLVSFKPLP